MTDAPEMLSVADLAIILGISVRSVYRALDRGEIPARRVGDRWLISKPRIVQWLNGDNDEPAADDRGHLKAVS